MENTVALVSFPKEIKLIKDKKNTIFISLNGKVDNELDKLGIKFNSIEEYVSKEFYKNLDKQLVKFAVGLERLKIDEIKLEDILSYNGIGFLKVAVTDFFYTSRFHLTVFDLIKKVALFNELIKKTKAEYIIVAEKSLYSHISKSMKIKTISSGVVNKEEVDNIAKSYLIRHFLYLTEKKKRLIKKSDEFEKYKPGKKKVLVLSRTKSHLDTILPVIKEIRKKYFVKIIAQESMVRSKVISDIIKNKVNYDSFENYINKDIDNKVNYFRKLLKDKFSKIVSNDSLKNYCNFSNVQLYPYIIGIFSYMMKTRQLFIEHVKYIEVARRILEVEKPDIIVLLDENTPMEIIFSMIAKIYRIKSLVVQHGFLDENPFKFLFADKMAVSGPRDKQFFIERGVKQNKIIIAGQPRFDKLASLVKNIILPKHEKSKYKTILIAPGTFHDSEIRKTFIKSVLDVAKYFKNVKFVIKPHPSEKIKHYKKIINNATIFTGDLIEILLACDTVVTISSNVGLEAMIANKPLISFNLGKRYKYTPYEGSQSVINVYNKKELRKALNKVLYDKKFLNKNKTFRKKFIYNFAYKNDGKSTHRVVKIIESMIK